MSHTKGELKIENFTIYYEDFNGRRTDICKILRTDTPDEEAKANGRQIVKCWNCHDELVAACEKTEEADRYFGPADVKHKMQGEAKELRLAALAKVKKES